MRARSRRAGNRLVPPKHGGCGRTSSLLSCSTFGRYSHSADVVALRDCDCDRNASARGDTRGYGGRQKHASEVFEVHALAHRGPCARLGGGAVDESCGSTRLRRCGGHHGVECDRAAHDLHRERDPSSGVALVLRFHVPCRVQRGCDDRGPLHAVRRAATRARAWLGGGGSGHGRVPRAQRVLPGVERSPRSRLRHVTRGHPERRREGTRDPRR